MDTVADAVAGQGPVMADEFGRWLLVQPFHAHIGRTGHDTNYQIPITNYQLWYVRPRRIIKPCSTFSHIQSFHGILQ
jgi:hypothetical protein